MANSYIKKPESIYKPKEYSDESGAYANDIAAARSALDQLTKPLEYRSQYADRMNSVVDRLNNRKFSYDVNSDAMFQQLQALYNEQGKLSMQNTMGQAAALTGGYGNSYATAVGQQAYQQMQNQLADRIPELYQLALARYQQEGADLNDMYSILANQENTDYGRYRDTVTDYENDRAYRETALRNLQSMNQGLWSADESNRYNANNQEWSNFWTAEKLNEANRAQAVSEEQWERSFAENQRQFNTQMAYRGSSSSVGSPSSPGDAETQSGDFADGSTLLGASGNKNTDFIVKLISDRGITKTSDIENLIAKYYNNNSISEAEAYWLSQYYDIERRKMMDALTSVFGTSIGGIKIGAK